MEVLVSISKTLKLRPLVKLRSNQCGPQVLVMQPTHLQSKCSTQYTDIKQFLCETVLSGDYAIIGHSHRQGPGRPKNYGKSEHMRKKEQKTDNKNYEGARRSSVKDLYMKCLHIVVHGFLPSS